VSSIVWGDEQEPGCLQERGRRDGDPDLRTAGSECNDEGSVAEGERLRAGDVDAAHKRAAIRCEMQSIGQREGDRFKRRSAGGVVRGEAEPGPVDGKASDMEGRCLRGTGWLDPHEQMTGPGRRSRRAAERRDDRTREHRRRQSRARRPRDQLRGLMLVPAQPPAGLVNT
jgi:hypothetical protein